MDITWILVAHRGGAQLYEKRGKGELNLLQEIPHPAGRLPERELGADKPGRIFDRPGPGRHAVGREQQQLAERETLEFVRKLAAVLEDGRFHKRFHKLVLVAEPRFLGELRSELTEETEALISVTQSRDLAWMETQAIKEYLQDFTWPPPRPRY